MRVITMRSLVVLALGLVLGANAIGVEDIQIGIVNPASIPVGCAAALKCTPIEFCTANGMISNTSVVLTREQNTYRVPLTDCRDLETGIIGKCCRDPYYTDPWPTNQIGKWVPGVFGGKDGKYEEGGVIKDEFIKPKPKPKPGAAVQIGIGQIGLVGQGEILQQGVGQIVKPGQEILVAQGGEGQAVQFGVGQLAIGGGGQIVKQGETIVVEKKGEGQAVQFGVGQIGIGGEGQIVKQGETVVVEQGGGGQIIKEGGGALVSQGGGGFGVIQGGGQYVQQGVGQYVVQGFGTAYSQKVYRVFLQPYFAGAQCGLLKNQRPFGNHNTLEADFAQYPWQAMVLEKTNKSLLCGGVITRPDVVITSAACVDGLAPENVLIKGGEWKLGVDEEPLPFQIVQAKAILYHPYYESGTYQYDVAILVLSEELRFADNIYPICMPTLQDSYEALYSQSGECVVTGWGKEVLQAHLLGSIMHDLNVTLVNPDECSAKLSKYHPEHLQYYNKDSSACAEPSNPLNNICSVDIGSALACPTKDGNYVLRGVYSWDSGCNKLGNQIGAFYKFDIEWYEWALGLIESGRFALFSKGSLLAGAQGKIKVEGEGLGIKQEALQLGQAGAGLLAGQGLVIKGEPQVYTYTTKPEIITYTTKPKVISYTTKPEIITYTTKPEIITYTTKPKIVTYTTKPEIITYTTKPKIITYTTKPEIISYTTKPEIISYTTKPQIFTYATEPKVVAYATKPQVVSYVSQPQFVSSGLNIQEGSFIPEK